MLNNIKKAYLPYLIGAIACVVAEVILFFFAVGSKSALAIILALAAIAATGFIAYTVYNISLVGKSSAVLAERDMAATKTSQKITKFVVQFFLYGMHEIRLSLGAYITDSCFVQVVHLCQAVFNQVIAHSNLINRITDICKGQSRQICRVLTIDFLYAFSHI